MVLFLNALVIMLGFLTSFFGKKIGVIKGWKTGYMWMASGIFLAFSLLLIFDTKQAGLFVVFGTVGMILEAIVDFLYKKVTRERLFVYKHLTLFGYGSLLSFPFWEAAGLMFYIIGSLIL